MSLAAYNYHDVRFLSLFGHPTTNLALLRVRSFDDLGRRLARRPSAHRSDLLQAVFMSPTRTVAASPMRRSTGERSSACCQAIHTASAIFQHRRSVGCGLSSSARPTLSLRHDCFDHPDLPGDRSVGSGWELGHLPAPSGGTMLRLLRSEGGTGLILPLASLGCCCD